MDTRGDCKLAAGYKRKKTVERRNKKSSHPRGENALGPLPMEAEPLLRALKEPLSSSF
jgi:hypothetical protein